MKKAERVMERFELLDHYLCWYGGFNATQIGEVLGITRQNISLLIGKYRKSRPPGTVEYDSSRKLYVPGPAFAPGLRMAKAHLFLNNLRGQELINRYRRQPWWDPEDEILFEDLDRYGSPEPNGNVLSYLVRGIRFQKVLKIKYQSRRKGSERLISPNRLVYAVDRYHLRAFCHTTTSYRDFVLTRILEAEEAEGAGEDLPVRWVSDENDRAWNNRRELRFRPNPKLPEDVIKTLQRDYPVIRGILTIVCNDATAPYIEMKFQRPDFRERIPQWIKMGA